MAEQSVDEQKKKLIAVRAGQRFNSGVVIAPKPEGGKK